MSDKNSKKKKVKKAKITLSSEPEQLSVEAATIQTAMGSMKQVLADLSADNLGVVVDTKEYKELKPMLWFAACLSGLIGGRSGSEVQVNADMTLDGFEHRFLNSSGGGGDADEDADEEGDETEEDDDADDEEEDDSDDEEETEDEDEDEEEGEDDDEEPAEPEPKPEPVAQPAKEKRPPPRVAPRR